MKRGWLKYLDHERFHVACLHLGERRDEMTVEIEGYCDAFHHLPSDYDGAVRVLAEMRPDIIFYPEVGMSGTAQRLAADRLAPVQCCAIGHPVTTGLSTIDYFVSGELIEPEGADAHYSERLVTLPGVSFPYMPAPLEEAGLARSHFDLPDDATLFLCLQTPQKYLPADDGLYARIAAEVPNALFVFLGGGSSMFDMSILRDRMVAACVGLDRTLCGSAAFESAEVPIAERPWRHLSGYARLVRRQYDAGGNLSGLADRHEARPRDAGLCQCRHVGIDRRH